MLAQIQTRASLSRSERISGKSVIHVLITFRRKFFLRIADIYFSDDYNMYSIPADIAAYLQSGKYMEACAEFHTLQIDLTKSKEIIFSEFHKNTRIHINKKTNKDQFQYSILELPSDRDIKEYAAYYNRFAKTKKLKRCNVKKLKALQEKNGLVISRIFDAEGDIMCSMAYIVDGIRARVLYSASLYRLREYSDKRNIIGRAHRYMSWLDIIYFKDKGFSIYDLGGLAMNEKREELKNIDSYKLNFGGRIVNEYNMYIPLSILGRMAVFFLRLCKSH